ncbi:MAG: phage tail family protein [Clostridiales bacterium]|nr:phage tail family protein [Clostridiales bacterium]
MERIEIVNARGESLVLDYYAPPFYLIPENIRGLTDCDLEPATVRGYQQHGADWLGTYADERIIGFSFYVHDQEAEEFYRYRREFGKVANPLLGDCTIRYVNDYRARRIRAHCTQLPKEQAHFGTLRQYYAEFTASSAFWESDVEHAARMNEIVGGWTLPFNFMGGEPGINFGTAQSRVTIDNDGDQAMPVRIEISAGAINPKVRLTSTGEFIKVNKDVPVGKKMIINTAYGNKSAILVDAVTGEKISDAFSLLAPGSTFFSVPLGRQTLVYTSDDAYLADVWVYWRNLYLAV